MISEKTRKKLSESAKRNNFGGTVLVDVICSKCNKKYKGIHNQLICIDCKTDGYDETCKHCKSTYKVYGNDKTFCCSDCKINQPWKRRKRGIDVREKISNSKKKWYKTDEGKEFAKKIGKINSKKMIEFNKTDTGKELIKKRAIKQSEIMSYKIANGDFTPPITNTFTHWDAIIGDKKFRSSWEACFWVSNQHLLYESKECRTSKQNNGKVYVGDFFDTNRGILYEIKPRSFYLKQSNKIDALIEHCKNSGYKFIWISEYNIMNYIDESVFTTENELKQLNKLKDAVKKN